MNETLKIDGTTFVINHEMTPASAEAENLLNIAREMRNCKIKRQLTATRKNGRNIFIINEYENGTFYGHKGSGVPRY